MSKKSRKVKKTATAKGKSVLGLKKTVGKVNKESLVKALSQKSVSVTAPPVSVVTGRKKRKHHGKKIANAKLVKQINVSPEASVSQNTLQAQKGSVAPSEEARKGKKKRKRCRKKGTSLKLPSADRKLKEPITAVSISNGSVKEGGTSGKRRKRKAAQEVLEASDAVVKSVNPLKRVKLEEASSDGEPELIHADWGLADGSADEVGCKAEGGSESDLDVSEEDVDEEPQHPDEGGDDSDVDVGINDVKDPNMDDYNGKKPEDSAQKPNLKIDGTGEPEVKEQECATPSGRISNKKFSLSDKANILKEIEERTAEFESRCLYVAPIPGDCTFDMLKKFIPKMKTCRFFTRPRSNKLRTFAFVEFADAETAAKEKLSISGRLFAGQSMRAEIRSSHQHGDKRITNGVHGPENIDFSCIMITGLTPEVNQTELKSIFPTAESIRLPASSRNFNYGYAILKYVSDAVALDAFSQCHGLLLKGRPISVNFAFKSSKKKAPAGPTTTLSNSNEHIRLQGGTQPAQNVKKVVIQPMVNASNAEGGVELTSVSPKPTRIHQLHAQNLGGREGTNKDEVNKAKLVIEEAKGDGVARVQSASLLSGMIKQAKKIKDEEVIELESDGGGEDPDADKGAEAEGDSEEGESDDDEGGENDGTDGGESDGEDEMGEAVSAASASASDDDGKAVGMPVGDDSEAERIDASLAEVLKARRTCAKALKSPGAKRNWKATMDRRRPGAMPTMLPVPKKIRR